MTCDTREQDLLLLAHGELPLLRRLAVRAHIARCSACRERYARLTRVSALLAGVVRGPQSPPWSLSLNRAGQGIGPQMRAAQITLLILAIFAVMMTLHVVSGRRAPAPTPAPGIRAVKPSNCPPGLSDDKCHCSRALRGPSQPWQGGTPRPAITQKNAGVSRKTL